MNQQSGVSVPMRLLLAVMAAVVTVGVLPIGLTMPPMPAAAQETAGEEVIVVLDDGEDPVAAAQAMGVEVEHIYRHVFNGFAGTLLPPSEIAPAARSRRINATILPDGAVQAEAQIVPTGVSRPGVPVAADGQHLDVISPVDADIAILDTGISDSLPDLNVVGGVSCVGSNPDDWEDGNGHGTHVSGIAAAKDNDDGVVGVAPGARLWSVRVLDNQGFGTFSDVICGLDWVAGHADTIDVINLSLSGEAKKGENKRCASSAFHQATCAVVMAGIPVVVAAGNQGANANTRVPAAFPEVITVSGIADSDGRPGKLGPRTCFGHNDDSFLSFSNFGAVVDIAAPGDCILSYRLNGGLIEESGTSEASPHVAGAAAHFIADYAAENGQRPTPAQVKTWLQTEASRSQAEDGVSGDRDSKKPKKDKKKKKGKKAKNKKKDRKKKKSQGKKARKGPQEPVLWLEVLSEP
jgi:subtilisin family serine protease